MSLRDKLKKVLKVAAPVVAVTGLGGGLAGKLFGKTFASKTVVGRLLSKGIGGALTGNLEKTGVSAQQVEDAMGKKTADTPETGGQPDAPDPVSPAAPKSSDLAKAAPWIGLGFLALLLG